MNVVITGGSSGIGLALAAIYRKQGHAVVATSRNELDLLSEESIAQFASSLPFEKIDVLINNAGFGVLGPLTELSSKQILEQFQSNVFGPLALVKALLPKLHGGHLVNVSSISPEIVLPFGGIYTASKAAMNVVSDVWRLELAHLGVRVTTIRPGLIQTNFAKNVNTALHLAQGSSFERFRDSIMERATMSTGGMGPDKFAAHVFKKLEKRKKPAIIYYGKGAWIYPLLSRLIPYELQHKLILNRYGLA
jgi:short-subunit dehydrogenase